MTEEIVQAPQQATPAAPAFDFDKEFDEQKKKDIETFKNYGLITKEDLDTHVKQYVDSLRAENAALRAEFEAWKVWANRKKVQGMNSGGTEKAPDNLAHWKPAW